MQILKEKQAITALCKQWHAEGQRIVLVPTMGYYHAGHEALMRHARTLGQKVVVSLFVNPTQFAPGEDLASYPRDFERDASIAQSLGVDALFAPEVDGIYSPDRATAVTVSALSQGMCGLSRPTHFHGVCLVVLKLFMITQADCAVFGQKDWQQLAIIRRMVHDLDVPIDIVGHEIIREGDGLAMSSRNVYLTPQERAQAPAIQQGLRFIKDAAAHGQKDVPTLLDMLRQRWAKDLPSGQVDYLTVVDAATLEPQNILGEASLLACAVRMGKARLIDNILL